MFVKTTLSLHACVHAMIHQLHLVHIYGKYGHHRRYLHVAQSNSIGRWAVGGSDKMVHVHFKIASFVKTGRLQSAQNRPLNRGQNRPCTVLCLDVGESGCPVYILAPTSGRSQMYGVLHAVPQIEKQRVRHDLHRLLWCR